MKKLLSIAAFVFAAVVALNAQVTTEPAIIQKGYSGAIKVIFNPAEGNKGMASATACYAHTGLITVKSASSSDWKYATATWRGSDTKYKMTKDGSNWVLNISNINDFYGCPESEEILKMAFVFNDGPNGTKEGKTASGGDIFVELAEAGLSAKIDHSLSEISSKGTSVTLTCNATSSATLTLTQNGATVKTATGTQMTYTTTLSNTGDYKFVLVAQTATETAADSASTTVPTTAVTATRPSGIDNGHYYDADDSTKVTLCTYAASKTAPAQNVFVVGDFNDWTVSNEYQMKRDGNYFWIEVDGLTPRQEYAYQYVVVRDDGEVVRIDDLYAEKVLHPNDQYEPRTVDPTLREYPSKADGYVSVIQTNKPKFAWSDATLNFKRPNKDNLIIYEMWVYDFTPDRSYKGVIDRLDYLENLGINALELMPITEFDGNYNWGYSPNHYFAPDKSYGSENDLKTLIDECHKRGIAVILDMVFNHATGLNPMNKLYPYGDDLKYNPWFNVTAPHSDNVYEDWNHDFEPAKTMFKRALQYWLTEYKIDGYRMDLAHGFCGANCNSLGANLSEYNSTVKATSSDAYFIQEYWGSNPTAATLVNQGMMCWAGGSGLNNAYSQTAMGWLKDGDGLDANSANKGDGYVTYCNSHDEERNFFKAKQYGNGAMKTDETIRCHRVPLNIAFNVLLNGSHMFYQYDELGYDFSKYQNINGAFGNDDDGNYNLKPSVSESTKTGTKPRPESHGYFKEGPHMQAYQQVAQLIRLRTQLLNSVFEGNPTAVSIGSGKSVRTIQWGSDVYVVGNFSATAAQTATIPAGTWYDYLGGGTSVAGGSTVTLQVGDLLILTNQKLELPEVPSSYDYVYVGINSVEAAQQGFVYPTVTDGMLYIASEEMPQRIQIYAVNGALVETASHANSLNVSDLKQGLYVMVVSYQKTQEVYKFIRK